MYTAYVLDEDSRMMLMLKFFPKYPKAIGHHITVEFGVPEGTPTPEPATAKVVGYVDSGDGLEVLVASVNGSTTRPDGGTYHITWSLDPDKYSPKDSNDLLAKKRGRWTIVLPIEIQTTPDVLR